MGKQKEKEIPVEALPAIAEEGQKKDGQRFSFSRLLIKLTGRAFLFTAAWLFIAFRAVVHSPQEPWVGCALVIAGCVTGLNIMGDKVVDAIATAISKANISLGSAKYSGPGGIPYL
jgi:hypothetical protein